MLPATDTESLDTMQTGELERPDAEKAPPHHASMTVTRDSPQPGFLLPPPLAATSPDFKFKHEPDPSTSDPEDDTAVLASRTLRHAQTDGPKLHPDQNPNESVRSWLQRITAMQQDLQRKHRAHTQTAASTTTTTATDYQHGRTQTLFAAPTPSSRVVKYQDLPYMGEMTLDNSKPRRGRKPKKADICHLIYKNYGTIFPGTPRSLVGVEPRKPHAKPAKETPVPEPSPKTNVQNRIISSLLEKRLTQESLRNKEQLLLATAGTRADQDEPLNLCIRDLNQLKIRLLRKHGNVYTSDGGGGAVKSEPASDNDDDVEFVEPGGSPECLAQAPAGSPDPASSPDVAAAPGGYVYWPNAGVFIHPAALHSHLMYYQKLAAHSSYALPPVTSEPRASPAPRDKEPRRSVTRHATTPRTTAVQQDRALADDVDATAVLDPRLKRVAATGTAAPTKRKRSAIFIPPIPAENQTNPATEVSICKFKFTGGAKPSLQEKKMLSVDSGGNFRYYSGTGDKSMRGYEFFPRETLQQQAAAGSSHGSGTGAFLQASGEKIPMLLPPQAPPATQPADTKTAQEFMFAPEPVGGGGAGGQEPGASTARHRKRKTRKSLQREKLEQTFKEKGFLIQTQQLESAEGATYCKFRQLRKFTRYLFRSWKDYLPGSVRELQETEKSDEDETDAGDEGQPLDSPV